MHVLLYCVEELFGLTGFLGEDETNFSFSMNRIKDETVSLRSNLSDLIGSTFFSSSNDEKHCSFKLQVFIVVGKLIHSDQR